jgi:DNA-binding LytR/AlgR family response regulator
MIEVKNEKAVLNCLVVDDDPTARLLVNNFIKRIPWIVCLDSVGSAEEATAAMKNAEVHFVLLDIEMPGMSGIDWVDTVNKEVEIVFLTSKSEYAVEAFEKNAIDYLVKPFDFERFEKACNKVYERIIASRGGSDKNTFYVKSGTNYERIDLNEVTHIESMGDYMSIYTGHKRVVVNATMKDTEKKLAALNFFRIHRSYIINMDRIDSVEDNHVIIGEKSLPISRSTKKDFLQRLNRV